MTNRTCSTCTRIGSCPTPYSCGIHPDEPEPKKDEWTWDVWAIYFALALALLAVGGSFL